MLTDKNEHIVFSVFETDNLEEIKKFLNKEKTDNYKIYYKNMDLEKDITIKRGGAHFPIAIFFKPKLNDIIIKYTNKYDGLIRLSDYISKNLNIPFYQFTFSNQMMLYKRYALQKNEKGNILRLVYTMQDPKWIYHEQGELLPFEDKDNYNKKRISERLNKKIITEYCLKLGLDIENENFWESSEDALYYECIEWMHGRNKK